MKTTNRQMEEEIVSMRKSKSSWSKHEQEVVSANIFYGLFVFYFLAILENFKRFLVVVVICGIKNI